ncbi:MLO-like protein 6 [Tanacetum coccineum]
MAGATEGRSLEQTPTWALATVCFVLIAISIVVERSLHKIEQWFVKKHKRALFEALEKIKSGTTNRDIWNNSDYKNMATSRKLSVEFGNPCSNQKRWNLNNGEIGRRRRLLHWSDMGGSDRRVLTGSNSDSNKCAEKVCFFRQFVRSVPKVDYLTLRHGFIIAHLAADTNSSFDFSKYINRSLEEDFKVVVGISPPIWLFAVAFLLLNTHGEDCASFTYNSFTIVLLVGTKLQEIVTKMGLKIQDRGKVIKGVPVVEPGDDLFWFNRPRLLLYLLNFVLFQNAFQLAFFTWIASSGTDFVQLRNASTICPRDTGELHQRMGSTMRPTIFNERIATALKNWHHTARKNIKESKKSGIVSPMSSRPSTPSTVHNLSPIHLLGHYRGSTDSLQQTSPSRLSYLSNQICDVDGAPSPRYPMSGDITGLHEIELSYMYAEGMDQVEEPSLLEVTLCSTDAIENQNEVMIRVSKDFSFDKRPNI